MAHCCSLSCSSVILLIYLPSHHYSISSDLFLLFFSLSGSFPFLTNLKYVYFSICSIFCLCGFRYLVIFWLHPASLFPFNSLNIIFLFLLPFCLSICNLSSNSLFPAMSISFYSFVLHHFHVCQLFNLSSFYWTLPDQHCEQHIIYKEWV